MKYKRLSAQKHKQIIRCFCADITTACAEIVGVEPQHGKQLVQRVPAQDTAGGDCRDGGWGRGIRG